MDWLRTLVAELHRRSIWQILGIYGAASWAVLQVVDTVSGAVGLPEWFPPLAFLLLLIGFPIVLCTAVVQAGSPTDSPGNIPEQESAVDGRRSGERPEVRLGRSLNGLFTWRNAIGGGVLAFALWGVMAAGWIGYRGIQHRPSVTAAPPAAAAAFEPSPYKASVAVLPFDNLGGAGDEILSEGFTEELIAQLARVEGLKVISRTSVVALKKSGLTLPQIAETLAVQHVLEGSVRRFGDDIRVTAQLLEAPTDAHLWADSYTRSLVNLFALQEEIALAVTRELVQAVPELRGPKARGRTANPEAYEAYLEGTYLLQRRNRDALLRAVNAFERAQRIDPGYAAAYAAHAAALGVWVFYGHEADFSPFDAWSKAIHLADRALAFDPAAAQAYAARGYILTKLDAAPEDVEADLLRALELQPQSADFHGWYAIFLVQQGRTEAALEETRKAIELDPVAPGQRVIAAGVALAARNYSLALSEARAALRLEAGLAPARALGGLALLLSGDPQACLDPTMPTPPGVRAMCLYSVGRRDAARIVIDSLTRAVQSTDGSQSDLIYDLHHLAAYHAWIGDADGSLDWLERAYARTPFGIDIRVLQSGVFDRVANHRRFAAGLKRLQSETLERVRNEARRLASSAPRV